MRYLFPIVICCLMLFSSCGSSKKATKEIEVSNNVSKTITEIATALSGTLGLNNSQKASLSGTLNSYLTGINNLPENTTQSKLNELKTVALRNIKDMFTTEQYAQLMKLGGKHLSAKSLAKSLNGGATMSAEAANILAELLSD